jgi:hypothetical protein
MGVASARILSVLLKVWHATVCLVCCASSRRAFVRLGRPAASFRISADIVA